MLPMLAVAWLFVQTPLATPVRDELVASPALGRTMKYRVLLPEDYEPSRERYRVLYLLHGLGGDYLDWSTRTDIGRFARSLPLIIVMPDGENAWYTNAAQNGPRFEDYIADDLVKDVERKYPVIRARYGRAIAGLSMGGYGALKIALKHPGTFAVAGSFSGALGAADPSFDDARAYKESLYRVFGPPGSEVRGANDLTAIVGRAVVAGAPAIYMDCGTSDDLLESNRTLAAVLQKRGFAYEYHETAGAHAWDYWNRRIEAFLPWLMKAFGASGG
jgi:putative tributyrin esterase